MRSLTNLFQDVKTQPELTANLPKQQPGWMFDIPATANQHHRYDTFEPVLNYIKAKIWYGSQQMTKNDKMGRKMLKRMVQL